MPQPLFISVFRFWYPKSLKSCARAWENSPVSTPKAGVVDMFFRRARSYDREKCLNAAARAIARGSVKKAIAQYMKVLEADPGDQTVHAKVAPLLARKKRFEESWKSFRTAASMQLASGFTQKALGIYSQAVKLMPMNPEVWEAIAGIYIQQGKKADAVQVFYKGHRHFRKKPHRDVAVSFLRKAFSIEPWEFEVTFELARFLKKTGRAEALGLLKGLAGRVKGKKLIKVRSAMFFMQPGFSMAWKWFRSLRAGA